MWTCFVEFGCSACGDCLSFWESITCCCSAKELHVSVYYCTEFCSSMSVFTSVVSLVGFWFETFDNLCLNVFDSLCCVCSFVPLWGMLFAVWCKVFVFSFLSGLLLSWWGVWNLIFFSSSSRRFFVVRFEFGVYCSCQMSLLTAIRKS